MHQLPVVSLSEKVSLLGTTGAHVSLLWQQQGSLAFVARGRAYRSEFHINPSDEVTLAVKGELRLHYRDADGKEAVAVVPEGAVVYTPAGVPHSPRFGPDAYVLVLERERRAGEVDTFQWYCPTCDTLLHQEHFCVGDYRKDPVSTAYGNFYENTDHRTCSRCGHVVPNELESESPSFVSGRATS